MRGLELLEVARAGRTTASSGSRPRTWPTSPPPGSSRRPRSPLPPGRRPQAPPPPAPPGGRRRPLSRARPPAPQAPPAAGPLARSDLRRLRRKPRTARPAGPARGPGVHALRPPERPVLFRPTAILEQGEQVGAVDHEGELLALEGAPGWLDTPILPTTGLATTGLATPLRQSPGGTGLLCGLGWPRAGCACAAWPLFSLPRTAHRAPAGEAPRPDHPAPPPPTPATWRKSPLRARRGAPGAPPRRRLAQRRGRASALAEDAVPLAEAGAGATAAAPPARSGRHRRPRPQRAQTAPPGGLPGPGRLPAAPARLPGGAPAGPGHPSSPAPLPSAPAPRACSPGPPGPGGRRGLGLRPDAQRWPAEWILVDLPPHPQAPPATPATGPRRPRSAGWLGEVLDGHPVRRARYPLGADGEVERYALLKPPSPVQDAPFLTSLEGFRRLLSRNASRTGAIGSGGDLRFRRSGPRRGGRLPLAGPGLPRPSPPPRSARPGPWSGAGARERAGRPLAILVPGRLLRPALMHLVPGLPTTPL